MIRGSLTNKKVLSKIYIATNLLLTFTNSSVTSPETCVSNSFFSKADNRSTIKINQLTIKCSILNSKIVLS